MNADNHLAIELRGAEAADIPAMHRIRIMVKENRLSYPDRIREADYIPFITQRGKGWVAEMNGTIRGFAIIDLQEKNIWALFVEPGFEGMGIGIQLHNHMLDWYFAEHQEKLWLGTAAFTRAEKFYRKVGWKEDGKNGEHEIRFVMTGTDWQMERTSH